MPTSTVSPSSVTIAAGGSATVSLKVDTSVASADGLAGGQLTATGGDVVVQTAFGVHKEVESYDLTINSGDRNGRLVPYSFYRAA